MQYANATSSPIPRSLASRECKARERRLGTNLRNAGEVKALGTRFAGLVVWRERLFDFLERKLDSVIHRKLVQSL